MKFMLDECMTLRASRLIIEALKIHKPPVESIFLEDYLGARGIRDVDWAEVLADEGGWQVITCDSKKPRGQKAKLKGPPLHLILPAKKITGFFLSGSMASQPGFEKFRATICVWTEIMYQAEHAVPGTRFKIIRHGTSYRLEDWPLTSALPAGGV
jgi:hypothetical protein